MINDTMLKGGDSISSARNLKGLNVDGKKILRTKTNALGDVQNTLHSRLGTRANQNTNSAKSIERKTKFSAGAIGENAIIVSKAAGKNFGVQTPTDLEFHNHFLCEQADEACLTMSYSEYKLTPKQIETIVKTAKKFTLEKPLSVSFWGPQEDIETPNDLMKDESFSVNDIMGNLLLPEICAPSALKV